TFQLAPEDSQLLVVEMK
ncbi:MAG: hypothetical protein EZS28_028724, partial [Streblomastix strix]